MAPWRFGGTYFGWFTEMTKGFRAVVTQSYTEANVKNGLQYSTSLLNPALGSGEVSYIAITTGDIPIVLKGRTYQYDGLGVQVEVMESPVFSGGLPLEVGKWNAMKNIPTTVTVLTSPTVTDEGVAFTSPRYYLGDTQAGNNRVSTIAEEVFGLETIFAPNTSYLIKVTSLDGSDSQRLSVFATWYEGEVDFP